MLSTSATKRRPPRRPAKMTQRLAIEEAFFFPFLSCDRGSSSSYRLQPMPPPSTNCTLSVATLKLLPNAWFSHYLAHTTLGSDDPGLCSRYLPHDPEGRCQFGPFCMSHHEALNFLNVATADHTKDPQSERQQCPKRTAARFNSDGVLPIRLKVSSVNGLCSTTVSQV